MKVVKVKKKNTSSKKYAVGFSGAVVVTAGNAADAKSLVKKILESAVSNHKNIDELMTILDIVAVSKLSP